MTRGISDSRVNAIVPRPARRAHEEDILPFTGAWYSPPLPFHHIRRRETFVTKTTT
jgi:hypothetical protein